MQTRGRASTTPNSASTSLATKTQPPMSPSRSKRDGEEHSAHGMEGRALPLGTARAHLRGAVAGGERARPLHGGRHPPTAFHAAGGGEPVGLEAAPPPQPPRL